MRTIPFVLLTLINDIERTRSIVEKIVDETNERVGFNLISNIKISHGKIYMISDDWKPLLYLLHRLLVENIEFKSSTVAGRIEIIRKDSHRCSGTAIDIANNALDHVKKDKEAHIVIKVDESSTYSEFSGIQKLALTYGIIHSMELNTRRYVFDYLWNNSPISEISKKHSSSEEVVRSRIEKILCKVLKYVLDYDTLEMSNLPALFI